ncbi:MAG TPA: fused MFS/spermidine synthase [Terriglobales bacterium]|nr:fused MFS/spermidine synthase [Terriglobales bacterium]
MYTELETLPSIDEPSISVSQPEPQELRKLRAIHWWYLLFFVSGFPALLYQIVWQRALFAIYGVNIQSVTIVVTAFMLGLGFGSLAGGTLSKKRNFPLLPIFGMVEIGTGLFGLASLKIFHWAALFSAGVPPLETSMMAFALVIVPTMLMGSTLPLLVAHTVRANSNVGTSVSFLYAVNTLGSAAACFCAAMFLMWKLGESGTVELAAVLNLLVGASVLVCYWRTQERYDDIESDWSSSVGPTKMNEERLAFPVALILVVVSGFIALAYEIFWYRLFSYVSGGWSKAFAYLLGAYLAGIGVGSFFSERFCERRRTSRQFLAFVAYFVLAANAVGFLVAPALATIVRHASFLWVLPLVGIAAAFLGVPFPLLSHASIPPDSQSGARLGYLYMSNIIGSALGSYLIGFVLMDYLSTTQIAMVLAFAGVTLGAAILFAAGLQEKQRAYGLAAVAVCFLLISAASPKLFYQLYEKLLFKHFYQPALAFRYSTETRSGIVNVLQNDTVWGNGMYDGGINTGLVRDDNYVIRAYAVAAFHPNPEKVLMIGLGSGSWAQVIANFPSLQKMTIVEINPGYLPLIAKDPRVRSLLTNPRVDIEIDDGRRWLLRHPNAQFDVVVMNTSFNWRAHMANLLSADFLRMVRPHLKTGGQLYYNTTAEPRVFATGVRVYPYALRVANFLVVSDSPIVLDKERWRQVLANFAIDGIPLFSPQDPARDAHLNQVVHLCDVFGEDFHVFALERGDTLRARTAHARTITDDNMGTEWDPAIHGTELFQ